MRYVGIYWTVLVPFIKKSIKNRFGKELAKETITKGKSKYRELLDRAPDLGKGNPMAMNAYFAYVFVGAWLGSGKKISPDDMGVVMTDVLYKMKPFFGMTNLNSKNGEKKWFRDMKKFEVWSDKNKGNFEANWEVRFDEKRHKDGSFYYFTKCPICDFVKRENISEIMPALCATDEIMFNLQHGILYREHTLAEEQGECDYWVVGDKTENPQ